MCIIAPGKHLLQRLRKETKWDRVKTCETFPPQPLTYPWLFMMRIYAFYRRIPCNNAARPRAAMGSPCNNDVIQPWFECHKPQSAFGTHFVTCLLHLHPSHMLFMFPPHPWSADVDLCSSLWLTSGNSRSPFHFLFATLYLSADIVLERQCGAIPQTCSRGHNYHLDLTHSFSTTYLLPGENWLCVTEQDLLTSFCSQRWLEFVCIVWVRMVPEYQNWCTPALQRV